MSAIWWCNQSVIDDVGAKCAPPFFCPSLPAQPLTLPPASPCTLPSLLSPLSSLVQLLTHKFVQVEVFWLTLCSLVVRYQSFGGPCCLSFKLWRNKGRSSVRESDSLHLDFTVPHSFPFQGLLLLSSCMSIIHFIPLPAWAGFSHFCIGSYLSLPLLLSAPISRSTSWHDTLTLKMEAARSSEDLVSYCNTIWHHNLEDLNLNHHHHENSRLAFRRYPVQISAGLPAILTEDFCGLPHILMVNTGIVT